MAKKKRKPNAKKAKVAAGTKFRVTSLNSALQGVLDRLDAAGLNSAAAKKLRSGVKTLMGESECGQTMYLEL